MCQPSAFALILFFATGFGTGFFACHLARKHWRSPRAIALNALHNLANIPSG